MLKLGIAADVGASQVRVSSRGKDTVRNVFIQDADTFAELNRESFRIKEVEDVFSVCDILASNSSESFPLNGLYAYGTASQQFDSKKLNAYTKPRKSENVDFYKQALIGCARNAIIERQNLPDDTEYTVHFNVVLTLCIPVREHAGAKDCVKEIKEKLNGIYEVSFPLLEDCEDYRHSTVRFCISEKNINVIAEGACLISRVPERIEANKLSLVIDIGHLTMDIALFESMSILSNFVVSEPFAGRVLESYLRSRLNDNGIFVSLDEIPNIIETGIAKVGRRTENVEDIVRDSQHNFVMNYVRDTVLRVLSNAGYVPEQIGNLIVTGALGCKDVIDMIVDECGLSNVNILDFGKDVRLQNFETCGMINDVLLQHRIAEDALKEQSYESA